jgi:leucyl aminopeptidase
MKLSTFAGDVTAFEGGLVAVGRAQGAEASEAETALDAALGGALSAAAERLRFKGKAGQKVALDTLGKLPCARVLLLGTGDESTPAGLRDFASGAVNEALSQRLDRVGLVPARAEDARQLALGARLGAYRFEDYKKVDEEAPPARVERFELLTDAAVGDALAAGDALADAVCLARTLTNEPPNVCNPQYLAEIAADIAKAPNFSLKVIEGDELTKLGMGGVLAVGGGSSSPPRVIHLTYHPPGASKDDALAFVGKGITFDSGGLNVKTAKGMAEMFIDMGGAAAVLGAMRAVASLQPDSIVHGIVGAAENMPDGASYRPSDILTMYSGKTVEVLNTDAEGRLVLADCIHYATELEPRGIIDLATLTGACMVALGPYYAAVLSDDEALCEQVIAAGKAADERLWRLPLDPKLAKTLESKRADITNLGGPYGGAITAAQFLQNFKGETPWVHLDIAGAVLAEKDDGHIRAGATGFGVLTLWSLIEAAAS